MSRKNQNKLILGDWNAICDVCRFKFKASDLRRRWDNLMVCEKDWEPRHPQDFIRAIPDMQALPWTRPETSDVSINGGSASSDLPSTFNTLAGEENPSATQVGPDRAPYYDTFQTFDTPVPTMTVTPSLGSYTIQIDYGVTNTKNVFDEKITINGTIYLRSSGGSSSGTVNIDLSAYISNSTVDVVYIIEDINGVFHSVAVTCDPYFGWVQVLYHFDGTDLSTTITDSSLNSYASSVVGGGHYLTAGEKEYGTASLYCPDGRSLNKYIHSASNSALALAQEFTIEFSFVPKSEQSYCDLFIVGDSSGSTQLHLRSSTVAGVYQLLGFTVTYSFTGLVADGTRYHLAITRDSSNVIKLFVDGVDQSGGGTDAKDWTAVMVSPEVQVGGSSLNYNPYATIDEFRLTNGKCRYTADYSLVGQAFPDY